MMQGSSIVTAVSVVILLRCASCRPPERAETPQKSPVDAIVEAKEGFGFNVFQRKLISALNPRPIVDTMTEEERCCNTQQHEIGRKFTKGIEGLSNLVNSAFSIPEEAAKRGSTKLTEVLDNIGGRIVGLQK